MGRRVGVLWVVLAAGCLSTMREASKPREGPPPNPMWKRIAHPTGQIYGGAGHGDFTYRTSGTAANRHERVDAEIYRFGAMEDVGFTAEWTTTDRMSGGTRAEEIDLFAFYDYPIWPPGVRRRWSIRPGFYYNKINLKNSQPSDVEPWSWGFRTLAEAEYDIIKKWRFVWSVYGGGQFSLGSGQAKTQGTDVSIDAFFYGWQVGTRVHFNRFYLDLSWIDEAEEYDGARFFSSAKYGYEGAALTLGYRW